MDGKVLDGAARLRPDDVRAPAVFGEAVGQLGGERESRVAPQVIVGLSVGAFLIVERFDRHGVGTVGNAQQEAGNGEAEIARILRFAERIPFGVFRSIEDRLQILQIGDV